MALSLAGVLAVWAVLGPENLDQGRGPDPAPAPSWRLEITRAELDAAGLRVAGTTNLADRARLRVSVSLGDAVLHEAEATTERGAFSLSEASTGAVSAGRYRVVVSFDLVQQTDDVQAQQGYEPRYLSQEAKLEVQAAEPEPSTSLRELFAAVNALPRDPARIEALDQRAKALSEQSWISAERAAVRELRLALEEARRPDFDRQRFERHLLQAHQVGGL